jgi:hypothetical protein
MSTPIASVCTLLAAVTASACIVAANDGIGNGQSASQPAIAIDRPTSACFDGFLAQILPGKRPASRAIVGTGDPFAAEPNLQHVEVHMAARQSRGGVLLATSVCTVTRTAKVITLSTRWHQPQRLATLTDKDPVFLTANR